MPVTAPAGPRTAPAVATRPAAAPGALAGRLRGRLQRQAVPAVLVLPVLVSSVLFPSFGTLDNARSIAVQTSFPAIVALGMTLVILPGGIDLSVGSVFALGGVPAAWASQWGIVPALPPPLPDGFHRRIWRAVPTADGAGVGLHLYSPHGDMGFPGALDLTATYRLAGPGTLAVDCRAVTDRPTVVNPTNRACFNLAGHGAVHDHVRELSADRDLPVTAEGIPYGPPEPVAGTPFDLARPVRLGGRIAAGHPQVRAVGGLGHCGVLRSAGPGELRHAATLAEPAVGDRAGRTGLHGQQPRRHPARCRRPAAAAARRDLPGDPAPAGLAQPPRVPEHGAAARRGLPH